MNQVYIRLAVQNCWAGCIQASVTLVTRLREPSLQQRHTRGPILNPPSRSVKREISGGVTQCVELFRMNTFCTGRALWRSCALMFPENLSVTLCRSKYIRFVGHCSSVQEDHVPNPKHGAQRRRTARNSLPNSDFECQTAIVVHNASCRNVQGTIE